MDTLDETLFGASEPISFGLLSRKLKVSASEARKLLEEFYNKNQQSLSAAYTVTGYRHATVPTRVIRIVNASEAKDFASTLKEPTSIEIYALSPQNAADPAVLSGLGDLLRAQDASASLDDLRQAGFILNPQITELRTPSAKTAQSTSTPSGTSREASKPASREPSKPTAPASKPATKQEPAAKETVKPVETKAAKPQKSAFPFAKASKSEVLAKAFDNKPRVVPVTEKVVVQDAIEIDDSEDDTPDQRSEQKHKLAGLFDDNDDDMEVDVPDAERDIYAEEMDVDTPAEPEPEPEAEPEAEPEDEDESQPEPQAEPVQSEQKTEQKTAKKRKEYRRTKVTDANGNTITKTEIVWVTDDEGSPEPAEPQAAQPDQSVQAAQPGPEKVKTEPMAKPSLPKVPKKQGPKKQASLMSFFGKK